MTAFNTMTAHIEHLKRRVNEAEPELARLRKRLQAAEASSKAAVLSAITDTRPDMPAEERAALADAIVKRLQERAAAETMG